MDNTSGPPPLSIAAATIVFGSGGTSARDQGKAVRLRTERTASSVILFIGITADVRLPTRVSDPRRRDETSSAVESRHPRASRAERQNPLRPCAVPVLMGCSGCAAAGSSDTSSGLCAPGLQSQYAVRSVPIGLRRIRDASFHDQFYGPRPTLPRAA